MHFWKRLVKVGRKKCRLGVCNEHDIRVFDFKKGEQDSVLWGHMGIMLKTTSLEREMSLLVQMRIMSEYVYRLKGMGMSKWEAYKENKKKSINKTIRFFREQLARYKDRRLKFELFYLAPHTKRMTTIVISHLNHMPLKEALRRSRLDLEKRRCILDKYNACQQPHASASLSPITNKLMMHTVFSLFLGCMIISC
ncbi:hypothetical protein C2845_PM15G26380 [Panicum miliaceum]|uniref:Uncharacterized protein n=1 Tax=Panicum miliaceum TaxID=4540 RepID=A0A3L6Q819_PANMI|nr:hypothetical protein C2845_PM15G26380 [Panicum miliaceum]